MTPIALVYNMPEERREMVGRLAASLGLRVRPVTAAEYDRPVGTLCGAESPAPTSGPWSGFPEEMMVMAFFSDALMRCFLEGFKWMGLAPVRLKAVLTPTNSAWSSRALRDELLREEAAIRAMKKEG